MTKAVGNDPSLDPEAFAAIAELAYRESGLQLVVEKTSMIQSRLRHRLVAVGLDSFAQYAELVGSKNGINERRFMISALTTNVSHFFRENHHFEILAKTVLPQARKSLKTGDAVRIWSAGSSNGQEAFSIAMTILEEFPEVQNTNTKILATDIDPKVVAFSREGKYSEKLTNGVPPHLLEKYFEKIVIDDEPIYQAGSKLRSIVYFKELNLLAEWPLKQRMDAIFCRNVVIYFDAKTQSVLWPRFRNQLKTNGRLFLGHSERIADMAGAGFEIDGPTTYKPVFS